MFFSTILGPLLLVASSALAAANPEQPFSSLVATHLQVPVDLVDELLIDNTTEHLTSLDIAKWAPALGQPVEVLTGLDSESKFKVFHFLYTAISEGPGGLSKRDQATADEDAAIIRSKTSNYQSTIVTEQAEDDARCKTTTSCVLCIGAAATAATGSIASCSAVALRANNLRVANASPQAAEVNGAVIIAELVSCAAKPLTAFIVATGVCIKATGN
ncbi:hypothetical protein FVEG_14174 [Fusarium verticillioides 7600]|uniref:Uncharacterized protein n=1 Tax=Gibberella moniliformis (strain M3125 / FGSC 7600) TaxID=334819 RepID=A0A139YC20_GIBM7|nr:hypothetical protein FVEG_14174 [Fusarium verticillioides 7600]KYG13836.1 hypothetical protein FVEG_14174 [Fusarium verticillioides 7600]